MTESQFKKINQDATIWDRSGWEGVTPNVRLIEIVMSDDLRIDFLTRNCADSRQELDARNTESQKLSFWEKVSRK